MTQKELLYIEDAIGHEENIVKICTNSLNSLQDESIIKFIEGEIDKHNKAIKKLTKLLEECSNE